MNTYELTVVLDGKTTPAKKKSAQELIEKIVKTNEGKVVKAEDWGEKEPTGVFLHFVLELDAKSPKIVSTKLNVESTILRHLMIRKE